MIFAWLSEYFAHFYYRYMDDDCKDCENRSAVFRISFGNLIFHTIMFILTIRIKYVSDPRGSLHTGWFLLKIPLWIACIVGCFYIPQKNIIQYAYFCLFGAAVYIIFQCITLVDLGFTLADYWFSKGFTITMLMTSATMYATSLVFIICGFIFFTGSDCYQNNVFMAITVVAVFFANWISLTKTINKGIMPPSIFSAYISWLVFNAMLSQPSGKCVKTNYDNAPVGMVIIGAIFTIICVAYTTNRSAATIDADADANAVAANSTFDSDPDSTDDQKNNKKNPNSQEEKVPYNYSFFHLVYAIANCFVAMIIVNWQFKSVNQESTDNNNSIDQGLIAMWIKITSQWITILIFFWILLFPFFFPHRFHNKIDVAATAV